MTVAEKDRPDNDLFRQVGYSVRLALEVMNALTGRHQDLFAKRDVPWYMPNDEDVQL